MFCIDRLINFKYLETTTRKLFSDSFDHFCLFMLYLRMSKDLEWGLDVLILVSRSPIYFYSLPLYPNPPPVDHVI